MNGRLLHFPAKNYYLPPPPPSHVVNEGFVRLVDVRLIVISY